jgi:hypothetical protein
VETPGGQCKEPLLQVSFDLSWSWRSISQPRLDFTEKLSTLMFCYAMFSVAMRIFSPETVPELYVAIGRQLNEFNGPKPLRSRSNFPIRTNSSK